VEFNRIVAFSDGVFAIAITLLVLGLLIPQGQPHLTKLLIGQEADLLAYAISFAVVGRFWLVHHRFFGGVVGFDGRLIALNLFYLGAIVLIPFSSEVLGKYGDETAAVALYAVNEFAVVSIGMLTAADAHRAGLTDTDAATQLEQRRRSLYLAAVFLLSIPLALVAPAVAPLLWLVLFLDPAGRLAARATRA